MPISIPHPEVLRERWARGCIRDVQEAMTSGETHSRLAAAVSFYTNRVRTVSRRSGQVAQVTLPDWAAALLGVRIGGLVVIEPTDRGTVEMRPLTDADLDPLARAAVGRASRMLPASGTRRTVKTFQKVCEQCGTPYTAQRAFTKFCRDCASARAKASKRAYDQAQRLMENQPAAPNGQTVPTVR